MARRWQGQGGGRGRGEGGDQGRWGGGSPGRGWDGYSGPGPYSSGPPPGNFGGPFRDPPGGPPNHGHAGRFMIGPKGDEDMLRVLLRSSDAGAIIGKSGSNVRELRTKHKCQIHLPESGDSPERLLIITGWRVNIVQAMKTILTHIKEPEVPNQDMKPGSKELQILVPEQFMGVIIGRGGDKIRELRARTDASVKIFREALPGSSERSVSIQGHEDKICDVIDYILEQLSGTKHEDRGKVMFYDPGMMGRGGPSEFSGPPPGGRGVGFSGPPRGAGPSGHNEGYFRGSGGSSGGHFGGSRANPPHDGHFGGPGGPPDGNLGAPSGPPGGHHGGPGGPPGGHHGGPGGPPGGHHSGPGGPGGPPGMHRGMQGGHQGGPGGPPMGPQGGMGLPPGRHVGGPGAPPLGRVGGPGGPGQTEFGHYPNQQEGGGKWKGGRKMDVKRDRPEDGSHPQLMAQQPGGVPANAPVVHSLPVPPTGAPYAQPAKVTPPQMQPPPVQAPITSIAVAPQPTGVVPQPVPTQQAIPLQPVVQVQPQAVVSMSHLPTAFTSYAATPASYTTTSFVPAVAQQQQPAAITYTSYAQPMVSSSSNPAVSTAVIPPTSTVQQVTIPLEYTDSIIGPNGTRLQQTCEQSGCQIRLEEPKPGSTQRIITIIGHQSGIQLAQSLLQNSVRQFHGV